MLTLTAAAVAVVEAVVVAPALRADDRAVAVAGRERLPTDQFGTIVSHSPSSSHSSE